MNKDIILNSQNYAFGSEDSLDKDVIIFVDKLPNIEECKSISYIAKHQLGLNLNLCELDTDKGIIINCHKGTPDEVNNALYYTFHYHKENNHLDNPIKQTLTRNIPIKIVRAMRIILSLIAKSQYRERIKKALLSYNFQERINILKEIEFDGIKKDILTVDVLKSIAFQVGQTLALVDRKEYYTKKMVKEYNPHLRLLIERKGNYSQKQIFQLNKQVHHLVDYIGSLVSSNKLENSSINVFQDKNNFLKDNREDDINYLLKQFVDTKIDLKSERII